MSKVLAIRHDLVYEGQSASYMYAIHPLPTITEARCEFFKEDGIRGVVFREDSFDPVTRIKRGRFYFDAGTLSETSQDSVHNGQYGPHIGAGGQTGWRADRYFSPIQLPSGESREKLCIEGSQVNLGQHPFETIWRVVGVEKISTREFLFTMRAISFVGAIPELTVTIHGNDGKEIPKEPIQNAIDELVDAFHRQQQTPIVDVARETTRVMVAAWLGQIANGDDLSKAVKKIPCDDQAAKTENKCMARWAASIINRLHPRGKSSEQEAQRNKGVTLRPVVVEDAECAVHLVGLLLREFGWAES